MARPLRIEYPGAVYHVTARGNARMATFLDDEDRRRFLALFEEVAERFKWRCYAYCLMENHYHLLLETTIGNLSLGMRQINGVYTQDFNRRHQREGHLFQGRFKAILLERESYLLELCRHVVLNPVRAGVAEKPEDYAWSSFRATSGAEEPPRFLAADWVLSQFDNDPTKAHKQYRDFVMEGLGGKQIWQDLKSQCILGSPRFLAEIKPALKGKPHLREIPRSQRLFFRPSLEELFALGGYSGKATRNELMKKANLEYGYSFSQIGRHVGLHYATVSRIVRDK
jgi:putative transposase